MGAAEVVQWIATVCALGISIKVLISPIVREKALNRAFKTLEHEVAEQWEKVESHLGRISRLKRDIGKDRKPKDASAAEQLEQSPDGVANVTRSSLLKNRRASHAK